MYPKGTWESRAFCSLMADSRQNIKFPAECGPILTEARVAAVRRHIPLYQLLTDAAALYVDLPEGELDTMRDFARWLKTADEAEIRRFKTDMQLALAKAEGGAGKGRKAV